MRTLSEETYRRFVHSWKQLVLTDLVYKAVAYIALTPLVVGFFRAQLALSGNAILADQDILFFLLGPVGCLCFITVGALGIGIWAIQLTAMLAILSTTEHRVSVLASLQFALANAWPVIRVTGRLVALVLAATAPFLAVAATVYFVLLTQHDINYYLKERPPSFSLALGIGACLIAGLAVVLLRFMTSWFFALPLVVFEGVRPSQSLRASRERAAGHRRVLLGWILGWGLATTAVSALMTTIVIVLGRFLLPRLVGSLGLLTIAMVGSVIIWAVVNLAVNLLSNATFAAMFFTLYVRLGGNERADAPRLDLPRASENLFGLWLTPARIWGFGLAGFVAATAIGVVAVTSIHLEDNIQVMAHRGSSVAAPENTIAAFRQAIEDGADWIELDVQETADGEVVVFHDSDFMKLAGKNLKIWDATMEDLKDIDIGSWFSPEFKDERVPTLGEVLDECKGKIRVNIELKYYGHDEQLEQRVVDIVESRDMSSDVVAMSLKMDAVRKLKALRPEWKVGLLMSVAAGNLKQIEADFLAVNATFATRNIVRTAHNSGKEVFVWTVNDALTISTMMSRGVDGLLTDKPALARAVLEQRAQMSWPERLSLELAGILGVDPEISDQ